MTTLTDRESDVMRVLWDRGPSTVSEVREHLADPLAYTTVLTMLRILESKSFVSHTGEGRGHRFRARIEQHSAQRSALAHLKEKLFKGSTELILTRLVSDENLSAPELRRLRALLRSRPTTGKSKRGAGK